MLNLYSGSDSLVEDLLDDSRGHTFRPLSMVAFAASRLLLCPRDLQSELASILSLLDLPLIGPVPRSGNLCHASRIVQTIDIPHNGHLIHQMVAFGDYLQLVHLAGDIVNTLGSFTWAASLLFNARSASIVCT